MPSFLLISECQTLIRFQVVVIFGCSSFFMCCFENQPVLNEIPPFKDNFLLLLSFAGLFLPASFFPWGLILFSLTIDTIFRSFSSFIKISFTLTESCLIQIFYVPGSHLLRWELHLRLWVKKYCSHLLLPFPLTILILYDVNFRIMSLMPLPRYNRIC